MDNLTSTERYKTIIDLTPDVVYTLSTEGVITSLSPSFETITGWKRKDWIGKKFKDIVHPDDLPRALKIFGESMNGTTHKFYELRILGKDGNYRDFQFSGVPDIVDNKVIGKIGFARDVTDLHVQQRLYTHHSNLVYSSDIAIFSCDLDGLILSWNPACEYLFGYSADEVIGKDSIFLVPNEKKEELPHLNNCVKRGIPIERFETLRLRKDNKRVAVEYRISPINDNNGKLVGAAVFVKDITHRLAEEKLRYHYTDIIRSSDAAIISRDLSGNIETWNESAEKLFGYKSSEVVGKNFTVIVPQDLKKEFERMTARIKKGETIEGYETTRISKSGKLIPVVANVSPIKDAKGKIIGISAFDRDNTDLLRQIQHKAYLSQATKILSSSLDYSYTLKKLAKIMVPELAEWSVVSIFNKEGKLERLSVSHVDPAKVKWAEEVQRKFANYADQEESSKKSLELLMAGKSQFYPIVPVELIKKSIKNDEYRKLVLSVGIVSVITVPIISGKNVMGSLSLLSTDKNRVFDNKDLKLAEELGRLAGQAVENAKLYFEAQNEIKKRKAVEEELRRSRDHLNAILANVADGITVFDENAKVVYVNDAVAIAAGYKNIKSMLKDPLKWRNKLRVVDENDEDIATKDLPGRIAVRTGVENEKTVKSINIKTGEEKWAVVRARPILDDAGNVKGAVSITHDITSHKELERRKDDFISIASHELKTPITSIKGFVHLLKKDHEGFSRSFMFLAKVDSQLDRLSELVDDLLNLSRMRSGKLTYRKKKFRIDKLVKEVVADLQNTTETHKIILHNGVNKNVIGDRDRISQVLQNLIGNATKYSPGKDKVVVNLKKTQKKVLIEVEDFGIGISPKEKDRIFDRFYRVEGKEHKTFPGLGIGLYLSSEIIRRHNGKIWFDSKKGKGSTFCFTLPIA